MSECEALVNVEDHQETLGAGDESLVMSTMERESLAPVAREKVATDAVVSNPHHRATDHDPPSAHPISSNLPLPPMPPVSIRKLMPFDISLGATACDEGTANAIVYHESEMSESDDDDDASQGMEGLLDNSPSPTRPGIGSGMDGPSLSRPSRRRHAGPARHPSQRRGFRLGCSRACPCRRAPVERVGNMLIFWPQRYQSHGWGVMGPHWFGPPCILGILFLASSYCIPTAYHDVGRGTATVCVLFTVLCIYQLINTSYRDPGMVRSIPRLPPTPVKGEHDAMDGLERDGTAAVGESDDETGRLARRDTRVPEKGVSALPSPSFWVPPPPPTARHRWCDLCQTYQPPDGAHCPDCNVCVAGYDHHCVWMGTCIGKRNLAPFARFNVAWLLYLLYVIVWVSLVGPWWTAHDHASRRNHRPELSTHDHQFPGLPAATVPPSSLPPTFAPVVVVVDEERTLDPVASGEKDGPRLRR